MKNLISTFLLFVLCTQVAQSATGNFKTLVQDYQYAVTVQWDQSDKDFLKSAEEQFQQGVIQLLKDGASPEELMKESLLLIPNTSLRKDFAEGMRLYQNGNLSEKELLKFIALNTPSMGEQGSSWSPIAKIAVGIVGGYVILKLLMITILYWDTDPNYGQTGQPPIKP